MIEIGGLFGLILLIGVVYGIVKTVGSSAQTSTKVLWVVLLIVLPFVGLILWFFLGPKSSRSIV